MSAPGFRSSGSSLPWRARAGRPRRFRAPAEVPSSLPALLVLRLPLVFLLPQLSSPRVLQPLGLHPWVLVARLLQVTEEPGVDVLWQGPGVVGLWFGQGFLERRFEPVQDLASSGWCSYSATRLRPDSTIFAPPGPISKASPGASLLANPLSKRVQHQGWRR